ncbi:MAG: DUF4307 domain-containing protein [Tetrasphaera sp.]
MSAASASPAAPTRTWWIVGVLGCLAMLAVAVWFGLSATLGRVSWQTTSYAVRDDAHVEVSFRIDRPADTEVTCTVKAMDVRFGAVGLADVVIPAGPQRQVTHTEVIRTTARAVTGTVTRCVTS